MHYDAGLHSTTTDTGADGHNSLTNNPQPRVIRQAEDVPLLMDTPEYSSNSQPRARGIYLLSFYFSFSFV